MARIGSRYQEGLVIAEWKSHIGSTVFAPDGVSTEDDHIVKRLVVKAQQDAKRPSFWDLVGYIEIEVISVEDGTDEGYYDGIGREVYRLPFPLNPKVRKQVLRQMQAQPHFHRVA